MSDITIQVPESDYNSILRQAVAVIDKTRNIVAASVTSAIGSAHWELGKLLPMNLNRSAESCLTELNSLCWTASKAMMKINHVNY